VNFSAGGDRTKPGWVGWQIPKVSGGRFTQSGCDLAFWLLSAGHASAFGLDMATPSWNSFVPNLDAEFGLALVFASMIPIYWRAGRKQA
jgi:hypothetical protein